MPTVPPPATIRTQVLVPLQFADGYSTTARVFTFDGLVDGREHLALGLGDRAGVLSPDAESEPTLVRPHSECLTGDVFGSQRCDCGPQMREAVERIAAAGGFLLYLRQEGRGIGLYAKLDAYALQDAGLDTYEANVALGYAPDQRDYTVAAQMLHALGLGRVALLSNNPDKASQLGRLGITVTSRVPTGVHVSASNRRYLTTKARRGAHNLEVPPNGSQLFGHQGELAHAPRSEPVTPQPVRGQQLVQSLPSHTGGDLLGLGRVGPKQRVRRRQMGPAVVALPADPEVDVSQQLDDFGQGS